ncbi:glycosyltransferase [Cellvibrio japonicus]|uniref:Glycosyl transferase, putative, gt4F n=1 Tax=Cellvibrio japonicus (strain Ueda107) TaxID=498211 RepID=B3PD02_CELJU|nr:glycosyltransferase [Cellvibrio japonicus]ACE84820.1 glycosyl transferase, putative, gt4F [Cellvibrio japonicus Ueda107]QEI11942.1 glycosyltransferase [Cellvibrio japonicus]QEI15516.1 glycosyltransferase [Cellvibrio japonicus]QEI19095.1 glycosyltransferase [Cellvibrio japonicus]
MTDNLIIYQDGLLSYSETFIKQQAVGLKRWKPTLVGHKYQRRSLDFSMLPSQLLIPENTFFARKWLYLFRRWRNQADPLGVKQLQQLAPRLLHVHFGTSAVDIWPYAKAMGLPMLVTLHGFDISIHRAWWEAGKRGSRKRTYPAQLLAMAQDPQVHFLAVSKAIRQRAINFGIAPEKITISYIGVDADAFTPGTTPLLQRSNRILYVGRLVEKKGANYLLEAFQQVKQQVHDAELIIVGKGPMEERLKQRIAELKLEGVTFTGALSNQQVKAQIDAAKVFCLPSITAVSGDAEGLPISILEAQASGIFVVTSSSGGVGDNLIDQETCFTFPEKDQDKLAAILTELLTHTDKHTGIIDSQRALIQRTFRLDNCCAQLENLYNRYAAAAPIIANKTHDHS